MNLFNTATVPIANLGARLSKGLPGELIRLPLVAHEDAPQIIAYLKQLSLHFGRESFIREFTVSLFPASMPDNDLDGILRIITDFVRDYLVYVPDPVGTEYVISPVVLLQRITANGRAAGDCDDHVLLFNAMALSVGFEVRVAGVHLNNLEMWDHVISQVYHDHEWRDIDLCLKRAEIPDYNEKLVS